MMKENRTEGSEQNGSVTLAEEVNSVPVNKLFSTFVLSYIFSILCKV